VDEDLAWLFKRRVGSDLLNVFRLTQSGYLGECLVTLGTPSATKEPTLDSLLPAHNYAILGLPIRLPLASLTDQPAFQDMQDDGSERYITLLDPWHNRELRAQMHPGLAAKFCLPVRSQANFDSLARRMRFVPTARPRQLLRTGQNREHERVL